MSRGVIIQESIFKKGEHVFVQSPLQLYRFQDGDETAILEYQQTTGASCIIVGTNTFSEGFFCGLKPSSLVIRFGVGYDNIPIELFLERNLYAAYTPGTLDISVAEHTIALMLSCARGIVGASQAICDGKWSMPPGIELRGKKLAIIGLGKIGAETAKIAKYGLGMEIHAFGRRKELSQENRTLVDFYTTDIKSALSHADFVSLHIPINQNTTDFLNAEKLAMMKKDAILINTSRGKLVNEQDLYDALTQGQIAGAALDVFCQEPYVPQGGKDLGKLSNVLMTPHISSNTKESNARMAEACINNCIKYYENALTEVAIIPELRGCVPEKGASLPKCQA